MKSFHFVKKIILIFSFLLFPFFAVAQSVPRSISQELEEEIQNLQNLKENYLKQTQELKLQTERLQIAEADLKALQKNLTEATENLETSLNDCEELKIKSEKWKKHFFITIGISIPVITIETIIICKPWKK